MANYVHRYRDNGVATWRVQARNSRSLAGKLAGVKGTALSSVIKEFVENKWNAETEEDKEKFTKLYQIESTLPESKGNSMLFKDLCTDTILFLIFLYTGGAPEDFLTLAQLSRTSARILHSESFYVHLCARYHPSHSKVLRTPYTWKGLWSHLCRQVAVKVRADVPVPVAEVVKNERLIKDVALKWCNGKYFYIIRDAKGIRVYDGLQQMVFGDTDCLRLSNAEDDILVYTRDKETIRLISIGELKQRELKVNDLPSTWTYSHNNIFAWDKGLKVFTASAWTQYKPHNLGLHANFIKATSDNILVSHNSTLSIYDSKAKQRIAFIDSIKTFDCDEKLIAAYNFSSKRLEFYDYRDLNRPVDSFEENEVERIVMDDQVVLLQSMKEVVLNTYGVRTEVMGKVISSGMKVKNADYKGDQVLIHEESRNSDYEVVKLYSFENFFG
eukprot:TRINITY_DN11290_c0_g1_i2.p1 TRINITY_DN11290_c0_g1~~TRINITY_DN11290_c0_g1_i2.p1  ORF type:complete len:442 (+),score=66.74 TRINITY_DN11290_c0_g1_i2:105-1430(+)